MRWALVRGQCANRDTTGAPKRVSCAPPTVPLEADHDATSPARHSDRQRHRRSCQCSAGDARAFDRALRPHSDPHWLPCRSQHAGRAAHLIVRALVGASPAAASTGGLSARRHGAGSRGAGSGAITAGALRRSDPAWNDRGGDRQHLCQHHRPTGQPGSGIRSQDHGGRHPGRHVPGAGTRRHAHA